MLPYILSSAIIKKIIFDNKIIIIIIIIIIDYDNKRNITLRNVIAKQFDLKNCTINSNFKIYIFHF